jgi:hypothetical protein
MSASLVGLQPADGVRELPNFNVVAIDPLARDFQR